jgi:hypothetical protein
MATKDHQVTRIPIEEIKPGMPDLDRLIMDVLKSGHFPKELTLKGRGPDGRTADVTFDFSGMTPEKWEQWARKRGVKLF